MVKYTQAIYWQQPTKYSKNIFYAERDLSLQTFEVNFIVNQVNKTASITVDINHIWNEKLKPFLLFVKEADENNLPKLTLHVATVALQRNHTLQRNQIKKIFSNFYKLTAGHAHI